MVLEGELRAKPKPFDLREVRSAQEWQAYASVQQTSYVESHESKGRDFDLVGLRDYLNYIRAKAPAARTWLAYVEGAPVAFLSSWPGDNGVGQVEDLFTHPVFRHRGIATAQIAHGVADARERGAGPVIISADPGDTPKQMYADLGFRPLFIERSQYR
jgi:GNAT superfamily N-acetyltransferase